MKTHHTLKFLVVEHQGLILFKLEELKTKSLYLDKLDAIWFEGYGEQDRFEFFRDETSFMKGPVLYHGTHGARNFFQLDHLPYSEGLKTEFLSKDFQVGDVLTIAVCEFSSEEDFLKEILHLYYRPVEDDSPEWDGEEDEEEFSLRYNLWQDEYVAAKEKCIAENDEYVLLITEEEKK